MAREKFRVCRSQNWRRPLRQEPKFNVSESDYLVLKCHGYSCFEDFYYRLPTKEDLEKYFQEILHKVGAYRDRTSGSFSTYTKASPDWDTWKRSDDAACLRKLWTYGSSLCKTEMEDMTGGGSEKIRMTHAAAAELEKTFLVDSPEVGQQ